MVVDTYIDLRGLRFHYRDWGGAGQPLVLLHGLASTSHIWDLVAPQVAGEFRVVALDQRGHGESSQAVNGYNFAVITGDLRAFIKSLGLKSPILVGHSWGGNVALQYAVDDSQTGVAQGVAGLVLVDGGFLEISARMSWEEAEKLLAPPPLEGLTVEQFLERLHSWDSTFETFWSPQLQEVVLANFEISEDRTIRPRLRRENHMLILRALYDQKPSELYSKVHCPVLMIPASRTPRNEREENFLKAKGQAVEVAQQELAQLDIVWMEDTIHDIPLQRPEQLAAAIKKFRQAIG